MTLQQKVDNYPTKYRQGFTYAELMALVKEFPHMDKDKFEVAMDGNTCMVIDDQVIYYHCDVLTALRCGIGKRNIALSEWD